MKEEGIKKRENETCTGDVGDGGGGGVRDGGAGAGAVVRGRELELGAVREVPDGAAGEADGAVLRGREAAEGHGGHHRRPPPRLQLHEGRSVAHEEPPLRPHQRPAAPVCRAAQLLHRPQQVQPVSLKIPFSYSLIIIFEKKMIVSYEPFFVFSFIISP